MILLLGLFDLITIILAFVSIKTGFLTFVSTGVLILLGLKGVWTLMVTGNLFDVLGLLDLITSISAILAITHGILINFSIVCLTLIALKSFFSIIKLK